LSELTISQDSADRRKAIVALFARNGILIAFAVFMIGFTLANERFLSLDNVLGVVRSSAILGCIALGVTFVVISGNLDLSVGSMMSFSTIVVLDLHDKIGPALAIPVMFAMTMALGALIGFLVGYLKLNSLIVTLGMLSAIHGLTLTYSGGKNMDIADKEGTWFSVFGQGTVFGLPVPVIIFVTLALIRAQSICGRRKWSRGDVFGYSARTCSVPYLCHLIVLCGDGWIASSQPVSR
jgi:ribose/xylose/arabinose/galactoside ABC-type transport system permease subunit